VYACEWNPHAITALRHNLLINGVENQCIVIEDNRLTAPQATAGLFVLLVNMFSGLVSSPAVKKKSQLVFRVLG